MGSFARPETRDGTGRRADKQNSTSLSGEVGVGLVNECATEYLSRRLHVASDRAPIGLNQFESRSERMRSEGMGLG